MSKEELEALKKELTSMGRQQLIDSLVELHRQHPKTAGPYRTSERPRSELKDQIADVAIDWVKDIGTCLFCDYYEAEDVVDQPHDGECLVGQYLEQEKKDDA